MTTEAADRAPAFDPIAAMARHIEAGDQLGALTLARELHPAQLADAFVGIDHEVSELLGRPGSWAPRSPTSSRTTAGTCSSGSLWSASRG